MNSRRSFFKSMLRGAAGVVAASMIPFGIKEVHGSGFLKYRANVIGVRAQLMVCSEVYEFNPTPSFHALMDEICATRKARTPSDTIEIITDQRGKDIVTEMYQREFVKDFFRGGIRA